jgi:phosphoglycerate kinase
MKVENIKSKIDKFNLENKRVFLRADLNIPLKNGKILNDFKLKSILPTINLLQNKSAKIILATHIDRPKKYDPNLSTKVLIDWFKDNNYKIDFEPDINKAYKKSFDNFDQILLLDNLRFFPGEKDYNLGLTFAQELAKLADYYVNDAFGTLHRKDTSVTLLAEQFEFNKRTIGLLVEKEINALNNLIYPKKPFLIITGGGKISDKIKFIGDLVDKVDIFELCPAIVFTFLKAELKETGKSLIDNNLLEFCKNLLNKNNKKFLFPIDYLIAQDNFNGKLSIINGDNFDKNNFGLSIGPKSAELFSQEILNAKTIFFNGLFGDLNRPETLESVKEIFQAMANSKAYTVIGGGDSVAAVFKLGFENKMSHLSTGGGAILAYLSNKTLSGLKYF